MDITELKPGATISYGVSARVILPDDPEPDKVAIKDPIRLFNESFLPKRNTYHNWENSSGQDRLKPKHEDSEGS